VLSSIGLAVVARLEPDLAQKQIVWVAFSLVLSIAAGPAFARFRVLAAYKYIWILGSIILFVALALFGQEVNGARLWIRAGPIQFEPVELIKLFIVLFMASYLAETADVIAQTRPWSLRANAKYLGPLFLGWGVSMAMLVFERDLGMATLLLGTFVAMLYVATRRFDLVVGASAIFGAAAWWAATHYSYVERRIAVWRDPFADPLGAGYQAVQSLFSLANGGLFGTGFGLGRPDYIPASRPTTSTPPTVKSGARSDRSRCWEFSWRSCCARCASRSASRTSMRNCWRRAWRPCSDFRS